MPPESYLQDAASEHLSLRRLVQSEAVLLLLLLLWGLDLFLFFSCGVAGVIQKAKGTSVVW